MINRIFASRLIVVLAIIICNCVGPSRNLSYQVRPGIRSTLNSIKNVNIGNIYCKDTVISRVVRNLIVQELLKTDILVTNDTNAEAKIEITANIVADGATSAGAENVVGTAHYNSSFGSYLSGITAQINYKGNILASVTSSQVRTSGNPDPPEEISRILAENLICILRYVPKNCENYEFMEMPDK